MTSLTLIAQEGDAGPTKAEYEAAVYCDACFDTLDALDAQQKSLKVQVETRGIVINESKEVITSMETLILRMREQYYIAEKSAKKDKRKAWFNGLWQGGAGVIIIKIIVALLLKVPVI